MKKAVKKQAKRKVAIFDIDGTIFRSSLLIAITDSLIKEKVFPANTSRIYRKAYLKWTDRQGSYDEYIMAVVAAFMKYIKGVDYDKFSKIVKRVVTQNNDKVYAYTRDLIKELKKKNYYILAISQSPLIAVNIFCDKFGFDKAYGRMYEIDENKKFTGAVMHLDLISDKSKILKRAVEKENLTLKGSIGVGDSEGDISLMKTVETPICFNPNKLLYDEAKRHGWKVVVERKNMIYNI